MRHDMFHMQNTRDYAILSGMAVYNFVRVDYDMPSAKMCVIKAMRFFVKHSLEMHNVKYWNC